MCKKYLPLAVLFIIVLMIVAAPGTVKSNEDSMTNSFPTPYLVKDINHQGVSSTPHELTNVNGTLFFLTEAADESDSIELWESDGTASGTTLVKLFYSDAWSFNIRHLTAVNNTLFFQVYNPDETNPYQLWISDGSEAGTI